MKLDSGCVAVLARVWGDSGYNGLTDIILNFALSCAVDTTIVWVSPGVVTAVTNQLF